MGRIVLVTGGSRSGKSTYALHWAEARPGPRLFLATCPPVDDEMRRRIQNHRRQRSPDKWAATLEEPLDLAGAINGAQGEATLLIDCLTLWVSNLMLQAHEQGHKLDEERISGRAAEIIAASQSRPGDTIFVTNEVGDGVVPEHPVARRFRDLAGRCNQTVAAAADAVALLVCGIPLIIKGNPETNGTDGTKKTDMTNTTRAGTPFKPEI